MSRPGTTAMSGALGSLGAVGSKPPTRQGTAASAHGTAPGTAVAPGTSISQPATGRKSSSQQLNAGMSVLAQKLIVKLRIKFGDSAADVKGQEIISSEVMNFMQKGQSIREDDLFLLETRIRARLSGQTPVTNTLAQDKMAQVAGDEWARIYKYEAAEGVERDKLAAQAIKEQQRKTREALTRQMQEKAVLKKAEEAEELAYAAQEQAALKSWEASEEARRKLQQEIANKLKQERAEQLEEKTARRQYAMAKVKAEEEDMAARMAHTTKAEFMKEEADRVRAKLQLREFLHGSEALKQAKQQAKEAAWQEDLHYKAAWEAVLEKQEKERTDRLNKNKARQDKTAAFVASGALGEYKRWIDPAITERHFREREERLAREEAEKLQRLKQGELAVAQQLKEQVKERDAALQAARLADDLKGQMVLERARQEEAREQAKKAAREAAKLKFKADLDKQMRDNVAKKRYQPITEVERSLNRDLISRVSTWQSTGRVDISTLH